MPHVRLYDVEPGDHPSLPKWTESFQMDAVPYCGDEMPIKYAIDGNTDNGRTPTKTDYWMVIRRSYQPNPHTGVTAVVLAMRYVA